MSIRVEARYEFTADGELASALAAGAKKTAGRVFKTSGVALDHLSAFTRPIASGYRVVVLARAIVDAEDQADAVLRATVATISGQERANPDVLRDEAKSVVATDASIRRVREEYPFD